MEFISLLKKRRSIRKFKGLSIPEESKKEILKAGLLAPSSRSLRPWEFVAIENKDTLQKLSECREHGSSFLTSASFAVAVIADPEKCDVWIEDCSIAAIFMQLAAENLNVGSCWIQIRNRQHCKSGSAANYVKNILDIPQNYDVECIIGFGYKDENKSTYSDSDLKWHKVHPESFQP